MNQMPAYCTQFTDRECTESDCCMNEKNIEVEKSNEG